MSPDKPLRVDVSRPADAVRVDVARASDSVRIELERLARGHAATVRVGSVVSGSMPSVVNSGTETDAVLDFVLPTAVWHTDEWE